MGFFDKTANKFRRDSPITVQAAVTKTATFTGAAVVTNGGTARLDLVVSAHAGVAPTLDVAIQTSADGSSAWTAVSAFAQVTTTNGTTHKVFTGLDRYVRAVATISASGSDSYSYAVSGTSV